MTAMKDVRALVPRTPPEGMRSWVLQTCGTELERGGLIYNAEWAHDYGLSQLLDEWSKPRKIKLVRVKCSLCEGEMLLNWCKDQRHGYGFVHPEDEEGDWARTATVSGDETTCPMCGRTVLVRKRAEVKDWFLTSECQVMSAQLVGEEHFLALTGWIVQNRVYKSGSEKLEIIPTEAYVFSADDCAKLMGWRNSYSGTAGYFITYSESWRQPRDWEDQWGVENNIFGLTPELVAASCLPHCKLDKYMAGRVGEDLYPVLYLRLYQEHPNVEGLLLHGLPRVLDDLIDRANKSADRQKPKGRLNLPEINWSEKRPAQMLHLTKEELHMAKDMAWGFLFWDLFIRTKAAGELLTDEDILNAFRLGDEYVGHLVGRGPVAKSIRYLLDQCVTLEEEVDDADADAIPDVQILTDYWTMAENLGRDLSDPSVRFPRDLIAAHDRMSELTAARQMDSFASQFRIRRKLLGRYSFAADGLMIRPAASQAELTREGDALHHCVGSYGRRHATGETAIFFIRRRSRPGTPYYTLELDEKTCTVRQNRGNRNCARTPEVQAFEDLWLSWLKAGALRDERGRPVIPERQDGKGRAA